MEQLLVLLDELIESALDQLYKQDIYLLEHEVHERTIVFRFGHYLQNQMDETEAFRDYYLDFEYNRNGNQPKRLPARSQNGALTRMLTVATGVFMVIETSEAAVSAAMNSHGSGSAFARQFFVKVNFVGVGRFVFACVADGRYIAEDIRKTYQDFENQYQRKQRTQANAMAWMKHLMLTPEQTSILYSLKRQKVLYDVSRESKAATFPCFLQRTGLLASYYSCSSR